ncbi:MAG: cupredoxin family protein [Piscinibacter sp.]|nr:cupredoxin family protein [Piscinibacter sp.]
MNLLKALILSALASAAAPVFAHGDEHAQRPKYDASRVEETDFGREGDPDKVSRTIRVDMADTMRFSPARLTVRRGETVRIVVHNGGRLLHEMVLGTAEALKEHAALMARFPNMEHADPNMAHVQPGQTGEIVWQFTRPGEFQFGCLQGGHFEAGMVGRVTVK